MASIWLGVSAVISTPSACRYLTTIAVTLSGVSAVVSAQNATLSGPIEQYNPYDRTWRVFFKTAVPAAGQPVEVRAFVRRENQPVTETWIYLWTP